MIHSVNGILFSPPITDIQKLKDSQFLKLLEEVIEKEPEWDDDDDEEDAEHDEWKKYPHPSDQNPHITYHYKPRSDDQKTDS